MSYLEVNDLEFSYPDADFALQTISFKLKKGSSLCVAGLSGSGKSTLLRCLAGLEDFNKGAITLLGETVLPSGDQLISGHPNIAYLSQDFALDPYHKVADNIKNKILHLDYKERDQKVEELLQVSRLKKLESCLPGDLSGGQKQKLAFARAVASDPDLLLLDEAFNQLDVQNKTRLLTYLFEKRNQKQSTIWVSHEPREIFRFSEKVIVLNQGKLMRRTTPERLYEQPRTAYEAALTGSYFPLKVARKTVYVRPENILISQEKTRLEGELKEIYYIQGRYEGLLQWKEHMIRIEVSESQKPGLVFFKINPYACKIDS